MSWSGLNPAYIVQCYHGHVLTYSDISKLLICLPDLRSHMLATVADSEAVHVSTEWTVNIWPVS